MIDEDILQTELMSIPKTDVISSRGDIAADEPCLQGSKRHTCVHADCNQVSIVIRSPSRQTHQNSLRVDKLPHFSGSKCVMDQK